MRNEAFKGGSKMFCTGCGKPLSEDSLNCLECEKRLVIPMSNDNGQAMVGNEHELDDNAEFQHLVENEKKEISERNQILSLQAKRFKPLGLGMFLLLDFCFYIPIFNVLIFLVLAFKRNVNINKRSFARSKLLQMLIMTIIILTGIAILFFVFNFDVEYFKDKIEALK